MLEKLRQFTHERMSRKFRRVMPWLVGLLVIELLLTLSLQIKGWDATTRMLIVAAGRGVLVVLAVVSIVMMVRLCRHRFQFRLKSLLAAMTVLSLLLGLFGQEMLRARREQQAVAEILELGASVQYRENANGNLSRSLLQWLVSEDYFASVNWVVFENNRQLREGLPHVGQLPNVESILIYGPRVTAKGIAEIGQLKRMPQVERIVLQNTNFSDSGLTRVAEWSHVKSLSISRGTLGDVGMSHIGTMSGLERLRIDQLHLGPNSARVTDAGLTHLGGMHNLRILSLRGNRITDAGLAHLQRVPKLHHLKLEASQMTDAGLVHLEQLTNLGYLTLQSPQITPDGVERLKTALPDCRIMASYGDDR